MKFNVRPIRIAFLLMGVLAASIAYSGVIVNATRFIYKSNNRDVSVRLSNEGENPALVQLWIDDGAPDLAPNKIDVPFVISSPTVRIEPKQSRALRLIATNPTLPQDRETMYWLNILEIPPKPKVDEGQNYMQFSVRTRLKLIYRPEKVGNDVVNSAKEVRLQIVQEKPLRMKLVNASANYLNFGEIAIMEGGQKIGKPLYATVSPFDGTELDFSEVDLSQINKEKVEVLFSVIDDNGASSTFGMPIVRR
ncbi:fimbrial biogenesis chaperone [Rhodoferax aquaticus]|uniref:Molecular chaperone n=1 Tax=Rhodoferax aquaticus TaxID=2527691 RepID=A0A515ESW6_9BURK|nr:molecular chaperone [Rhodoferax aquaticus]QDL55767.1 molecular chaperone [Rhodoferax aquaticus]